MLFLLAYGTKELVPFCYPKGNDMDNKQPNTTLYELKDISVASYLYASKQVEFIGKRRLSTGEVLFQFLPYKAAKRLVELYWSLQAPIIQPKDLFSAQRDLKDIIYSG